MYNSSLAFAVAAAGCLSLTSCVKFYDPPKDYTGPTATIKDTSKLASPTKAEVFRVRAIDGMVPRTSPMATPYGAGMIVTLRESSHKIPARSVTLTLSARDSFAADGAELVERMSGNMHESAEGDLTFIPKAGATYTVKGVLGKETSSVWLEDSSGHKVGRTIVTEE